MKKIYFLLAMTMVVFASCLSDEQTNSGLTVFYPSYGYSILMADQQLDSISFFTTESGFLTADSSWMGIAAGRDTFKNTMPGYYVIWSIPVVMQPNLTGKPRAGCVKLYAGAYQAMAEYIQVRCLGVTRPSRFYNRSTMMDSTAVLTDSASACQDSIAFTMFSNWNVSIKDSTWLHNLSASSGTEGVQIVKLQFEKNSSESCRENIIYLTSSVGLRDSIPVKQLGAVK